MPDQHEELDNPFRLILVAAKRAEQLVAGARARVASRHVKPTTVALEELRSGLVPWRSVTPEEYEALLQEELAAREKEEQAPAVLAAPRPPIPVVEEPELDEEDELDQLEEELEAPDFEEDLGELEVEEPAAEDLIEPGE